MPKVRPFALTIGGFDPSAGAGVLADIKTFEQHRVYGFAVNTANTIQTEDKFVAVNWLDGKLVHEQLDLLLGTYPIKYAKIGLVKSLDLAISIASKLNLKGIKVIWDPILKSSTNFDFDHDLDKLNELLKHIFIVTPNCEEAQLLAKKNDAFEGAKALAKYSRIYLKGGHNEKEKGKDYLFDNKSIKSFNPKYKFNNSKHGSGCIFSSSLVANLALGYTLQKACIRSKTYTSNRLTSNESLLAYHK